jgi:hypothetical protein
MARYSPRDPGYTRVPSALDALSHIATSGASGYTREKSRQRDEEERQRAEEERERQRGQQEEDRELDLYSRGFVGRDEATEEVPADEDIFAGEGIGMQRQGSEAPALFQGALPGLAGQRTQQALGSIDEFEPPEPPEPQVLALPGSYVEGLGFTPQAITDQDFVAATQARAATPRRRTRPGVEQVTEDRYFDPARSPEGRRETRESARDVERRGRLTTALAELQDSEGTGGGVPPELQAELLELDVPASQVFGDEDEDRIRIGGRDFPNTSAGQTAAVEWQRVLAEARSTGGGGGSGGDPRITGEVTRRQIAMAAARSIERIRNEVREMSAYERRNMPPGYLTEEINSILSSFGFTSGREFEEEMRTLRLEGVGGEGAGPGPGAGGAPGGEAGAEPTDEELAELVRANPGLSAEELLELWERGR